MLHEELRLFLQPLEEKKSVQINVESTWKYELTFLTSSWVCCYCQSWGLTLRTTALLSRLPN